MSVTMEIYSQASPVATWWNARWPCLGVKAILAEPHPGEAVGCSAGPRGGHGVVSPWPTFEFVVVDLASGLDVMIRRRRARPSRCPLASG